MGVDVNITTDYALIRSIIERADILEGFCGHSPSRDDLESEDIIYFYDEDIGLFPANVRGKNLFFHAAIPKENRGKKAIKAAKELGVILLEKGYNIYAIQRDEPHLKRFAKMIGFKFVKKTESGKMLYQLGGAL